MTRRIRIALLGAVVLLLGQAVGLQAGRAETGGGLYGVAGLGFLSLEKGAGLGVPMGVMAVLGEHGPLLSANLLDLGLFEGRKNDPRYSREYAPMLGGFVCVDQERRYVVPDYWCSGNPDVLRSFSVEVSYAPVDAVLVGSRPGKLFIGGGFRLLNPRTAYGTIGLFFGSRSGLAGMGKVALGPNYVFAGVSWGWNLRRLTGRR